MQVLRAGWEHREEHPQLVLVTVWTDEGPVAGGLEYLAGGSFAEGDGYMRTRRTGSLWNMDKSYIQADYRIAPSREIWQHIDVAPNEAASAGLVVTRTRIGWDSSGSADAGYVELSHLANTVTWNWSGGSGTVSMTINVGEYYHVKIRVRPSTAGNAILQVWINGNRIFNVSQALATNFSLIDRLFLYSYADGALNGSPQPMAYFDNWVVNNTNGAVDNGDPGIRYLLGRIVVGPGLWAQWARGGNNTGSNSAQVSEVPPDEVAWVYSNTGGARDAHAMEDMPVPAVVDGESYTIERFGIRTWAKVANAVAGGIAGIVCLGGGSTPIYSGGSQPHATSYGPHEYWFRLNPATSNKWSDADINALQPGYQVDI